jgi:hypothetical protein
MAVCELVKSANHSRGDRSGLLYLGWRGAKLLPLLVLGAHRVSFGTGRDRFLELTLYPQSLVGGFGSHHEARLTLPLVRKDVFLSGNVGLRGVCINVGWGDVDWMRAQGRWHRLAQRLRPSIAA